MHDFLFVHILVKVNLLHRKKLSVKFNKNSVPFVSILLVFLTEYSQKGQIFCQI